MNNYRELINTLKFCLSPMSVNVDCDECAYNCGNTSCVSLLVQDAADAIEQLVKERDAAIYCICAIEDALDRGNDNDWAREHIDEWRGVQEGNDEID